MLDGGSEAAKAKADKACFEECGEHCDPCENARKEHKDLKLQKALQ